MFSSIQNIYNFFSSAQYNGLERRVKQPSHIPKNILVLEYLPLVKAALEAKFPDMKFSYEEVQRLLKLHKIPKRNKKRHVGIPEWYYDKWLRKSKKNSRF